jgi:hypothetical protein
MKYIIVLGPAAIWVSGAAILWAIGKMEYGK